MTRALITGGSGFIGSALVARLEADGIEAVVFDRSTGVNNDILNRGMTIEAARGADVVFHLAGVLGTHELFDQPGLAIDVNCKGTLNVLDACRYMGAAYVGVTMPQVFPSIYTATKVFATRLATAYHREYSVAVSHVRAFNAFGPGQKYGEGHPQKIVPTFAIHAWHGAPIPIWGTGTQGVDLIHTRDLAEMFYQAWVRGGDDFTVDGGTGVSFTVNEVAIAVNSYCNSHGGVVHLPMRRGEQPTKVVATGEGWERIPHGLHPQFLSADLFATVNSYKGWQL